MTFSQRCCRSFFAVLALIYSFSIAVPPVEATRPLPRETAYQHIKTIPTSPFPSSLAVDAEENLYVLHTGQGRLDIFNRWGKRLQKLEGLGRPVSLAVGPQGRIFIGSLDRGSVTVYASSLNPLYQLGTGEGEFEQPQAITVKPDGTVYVADAESDEIKVYSAPGRRLFAFGGTGSEDGHFSHPTALAFSEKTGELVVADLREVRSMYGRYRGARIQIFTPDGRFIKSFGKYKVGEGGLIRPLGLAVDPKGRIMVVDAYQGVVQVFDSRGEYKGAIYDPETSLKTATDAALGYRTGLLYVVSHNGKALEIFGGSGAAGAFSYSETGQPYAPGMPPLSSVVSNSLYLRQFLDITVSGRGKVLSTPKGIDCPDDCQTQYREATKITLTAVPDEGQRFVGWEGDCDGRDFSCTLIMSEPRSVSAFFLPEGGIFAEGVNDGFPEISAGIGKSGVSKDVPGESITEDFESGDFSKLPWLTGGSSGGEGWIVQDDVRYDGRYAAKTPAKLADGETGYLETTLDVLEPDILSFRCKVSSSGFSSLVFKVDGMIAGTWSGERGWIPVHFDVDPGLHTFRWEYRGPGGGKGAWLDAISFPLHAEVINPVPDIKVNGMDNPCFLSREDPLVLTIGLAAGDAHGEASDWWLVLETPEGLFCYDAGEKIWLPGKFPAYTDRPLFDLTVHHTVPFPADLLGHQQETCTFHFGIDLNRSGTDSGSFLGDSVGVRFRE